jgi:hypothetical protein
MKVAKDSWGNLKYRTLLILVGRIMADLDFCKTFLDAINEDDDYRKLNAILVSPSEEQRKKAGRSTLAGRAVAHTIGIGWVQRPLSVIVFNQDPMFIATIVDDKKFPGYYAEIVFNKIYSDTDFPSKKGILWFKPKKKGLIHKEIVGMTFEAHRGDVPGKKEIENDHDLTEDVLTLYKNKVLREIDDYVNSPFGIMLEKKKSLGLYIHVKVEKGSSPQMLRLVFKSVLSAFSHMESKLLEHSRAKPSLEKKLVTESEALDIIKDRMRKYR